MKTNPATGSPEPDIIEGKVQLHPRRRMHEIASVRLFFRPVSQGEERITGEEGVSIAFGKRECRMGMRHGALAPRWRFERSLARAGRR